MQQDPWAEFRTAPAPQPTQQPAPTTRRVIAPAPPSERRAENADQRADVTTAIAQERLGMDRIAEARKLEQEERELRDEEARRARAMESAAFDLRNVISKIDQVAMDAADNGGWFETGFTGSMASVVPGSAASDLRANVMTIDANNAFNRLQQMRDNSPTGGALGNVTERELDLLKSTVANLDPSQSQGQFLQNLAEAKRAYIQMLERIEPGSAQSYSQRPGITFDENGAVKIITSGQDGTNPPSDGPRPQTRRDQSAPLGYETGFDRLGRDDAFDRSRYLQDQYGIDPGAETRLIGVLNANRGNANLTMDSLRQIYSDAGVPPPSEQDMQTLLSDLREGGRAPATGIDTQSAAREYREQLDKTLDASGDENTQTSAAIFGAARGGTFAFNDEITGLGGAVAGLLQGENPVTAYQVNRDLVRRQTERTRESFPITSYGTEIAGGLVTGGRAFGSPNTLRSAVKTGATEGAIYGFGSGEGLGGSTLNAGVGALTGGGAGAALQPVIKRASNALAQRGANRQVPNANALAEASERTGVPLRRMDVEPSRQGRRADLLQNSRTRDIIRDADAEDLTAMEGAIARNLGDEVNDRAAGQAVQSGLDRNRKQIRSQAGRLYDRAHSQAGDARIQPNSAIQAIDDNIRELTESGANQNAAAIKYLQGVREDMAREGGLTVRALRDQRTNMRSSLSASGLDRTDLDRRMTQVLDAAGQDIQQGLRQSPEALATFQRADDLWRQQAEFTKDVMQRLVGRSGDNSPEATAQAVKNFVRKDYGRAQRLLDALDDTEKAEVRSLIASSLGRDTRGNFSVARFLTHTGSGRGALIDERTTRLVFGDDGYRAIKDLRALAKAKEDAASATNRSNTGNIVQRAGRSMRTMMLGMFGLSEVGVTGGVAAPLVGGFISRLGDERAARLLVNPDFTRWLRKTPSTSNPRAIDAHFNRLRSIAARSPVMAADVNALERALLGAVNDNSASRLAAEEQQPQE